VLLRTLGDALLARGKRLLASGAHRRALASLALAARLSPSDPERLRLAAQAAAQLGERDRAARYCEQALQLDPGLAPAHELLMRLFLHGEEYFRVLERIHGLLKPRLYVETGVDKGDSIRLASPDTVAIGIDPRPALAFSPGPNTRIFAQTSDDFFARADLDQLLGGGPIDLAFVDGLHHCEAALRDFINLERRCHRASTILIHDCFPHDRRTAERERHAEFWSGDVWRLIVLLKKYRPDLAIHTVATPPTGLALVRNLDPGSRVLAEHLARLVKELLALDYAYLDSDRAGKLNLVPNDWAAIRRLLTGGAPTSP